MLGKLERESDEFAEGPPEGYNYGILVGPDDEFASKASLTLMKNDFYK